MSFLKQTNEPLYTIVLLRERSNVFNIYMDYDLNGLVEQEQVATCWEN